MEDEYLLRRNNGIKVFLEEVQDLDTNDLLIDESSAPKPIQVHKKEACKFGRVQWIDMWDISSWMTSILST